MYLWSAAGATVCAVAVIAGAFAAHALEGRLDQRSLALFETAARYFMYSGLGLILIGVSGSVGASAAAPPPALTVAAWALLSGALVFSGTVGALALGAPRWLGAVTPIGGSLIIIAFVVFAWAMWRAA
jgi:uncharacterized membrane protein YgdD (TMEM256/DUF423 family)